MVTRRALLGAGALTLLAGCGSEEEPEVDVGQVLAEQLRATQAVAAAYAGVAGEGRVNASARVELLEAAVRDTGGTPAATLVGGDQRQRRGPRRREQLGIRRRLALLRAAARGEQACARPEEQAAATGTHYHQTVESRFSISSTGRV